MINWAWFTLPAQIGVGLILADVIRWAVRLIAGAVGAR